MKTQQKYQEDLPHVTDGQPYAVHHTVIPVGQTQALYLHTHTEFEFFYLKKGSLLLEIASNSYRLSAGDIAFIPSGLMHFATCPDGLGAQFDAIVFSDTFLISPANGDLFRKYFPPKLYNAPGSTLIIDSSVPWKKEAVRFLKSIFRSSAEPLRIQGYLLLLWDTLFTNHFSSLLTDRNAPGSKHLLNAISYIHEHYAEEISLGALAQLSHMSPSYFCRAFKKLTHDSPMQYLNRYRILQSCVLLRETEANINEICYQCGYNNVSYFNREFRALLHCTPKEYRKRLEIKPLYEKQ